MKSRWLRFPPPLRVSIPLLVLAFGVCFLMVTSWLLHVRTVVRASERVVASSREQAAQLAAFVARVDMDGRDGELLVQAHLATGIPVLWVAVCQPDGTVVFSSRPEWQGKPLGAALSPDSAEFLARAVVEAKALQMTTGEGSVLAVHPVRDVAAPHPVRYLAVVARDVQLLLQYTLENDISDTLFAAVFLLASCLGLWASLHWFLARRVQLLLENTRLARTAPSRVMPITGGDEFAEISRAIVEGESRFQQLAAAINDVFYMVRADGSEVLYVSPSYERVWGRSVEALVKEPRQWLKAIPEEEQQQVAHMHEPLFRGAQMVQAEYRIRLPDGSLRWIEDRSFPVHDASGALCYISGLATDITERRHFQTELLNVAERERRSIGHDLHDDLCQHLAAIKLKSEMLAAGLRRDGVASAVQAEAITTNIAQATVHCRTIARGLSPVELPGEGFMIALEKLVSAMESLHEVACFFHCPAPVSVADAATAMHLYRITQEFMNNAVRHGQPERIDVRLESNQEFLRIEVVNDGRPYEDPGPHSQGMGLKILQYRAGAIGASFRIQSRSDGVVGTVAVCQAPCYSCNPSPEPQVS